MGAPTSGTGAKGTPNAPRGKAARGAMRPLPVNAVFPSDLPITAEEIHKVLVALGPDLAALFSEDG